MEPTDLDDLMAALRTWAGKQKRAYDENHLETLLGLRQMRQDLAATQWPGGSVRETYEQAWLSHGPVAAPDVETAAQTVETFVRFLRSTGRLSHGSGEAKLLAKEARQGASYVQEHGGDRTTWGQNKVLMDFGESRGISLLGAADLDEVQTRLSEIMEQWNALPDDERRALMPLPGGGMSLPTIPDLGTVGGGDGLGPEDDGLEELVADIAHEIVRPGEVPAVVGPDSRPLADYLDHAAGDALALLGMVAVHAQIDADAPDVTPDVFDDAWDTIPFLQDLARFVAWVREAGEVQLTATGNLKRADAAHLWEALGLDARPGGESADGTYAWRSAADCAALERLFATAVVMDLVALQERRLLPGAGPRGDANPGASALIATVETIAAHRDVDLIGAQEAVWIYACQVAWALQRPVTREELTDFLGGWSGLWRAGEPGSAGRARVVDRAVAMAEYLGLVDRAGTGWTGNPRGVYALGLWASIALRRAGEVG
ncbi:hypothetical protein [Arsenicicoccus sp. UBA7492]|uniref:hypothetical protein n=1 Tax=Arsenicicoccus sp. UBA7492 TaxID=1946057 RepID=UPI00257DD60E|nr:hypothetical protein [Arsenicicoccus sp. UBA7492]